MTFTFTISRPPLAVTFEAGSVGEGAAILQENGADLTAAFGAVPGTEQAAPAAAGDAPEPAKRGRRPKEVAAPAPLAVPGAAPAAPAAPLAPAVMAPIPGDPLAIPPGLQRDPATNASPAIPASPPAPPPPPLLPAAPPIAAAPPAVGVIATKIIAELDRRATGAADKGQGLSDWLAGAGLVIKGATYDEAVACLRMTAEEKLSPLLAPLGL